MIRGGGVVAHGLEVQGDAEGGADLVLAAVALADGAGVVIVHHEVAGQLVQQLLGGAGEDLLLAEGEHGALEGGQGGVEAQDGAHVVVALLVLADDLLVVGVHQEGQGHAVGAQGGLDDVGDIVLVLLLVEVGEILAGVLLVLLEVVVGAVGHAPQLAPAEGEHELEVGGGLGVEGQLLGLVVAQAEVLLLQAQIHQPLAAELPPVLEPLQIGARLAEELQLHLLKLPDAEDEVAGGDLVAEGLAHLTHAEGQLLAGGALDGGEVDEDALGGLGAQVDLGAAVLGDALMGLEHEVELADVGEVRLAAAGAGHAVVPDEGHQLLVGHGLHIHVVAAILGAPALDELVGPVAHLAGLAVDEGIVEGGHMAGGHPHLGVHEDGGVQAHVVGVFLDKLLPPGPLDVVFQLHAQGAVVPGVGQAAVDLATGVDEAPALAQCHDLIHGLFGVLHIHKLLFALFCAEKNALSRTAQGEVNSVVPPEFGAEAPRSNPVTAGDRRGISSPRLAGAFPCLRRSLAPDGSSLGTVGRGTPPGQCLFLAAIVSRKPPAVKAFRGLFHQNQAEMVPFLPQHPERAHLQAVGAGGGKHVDAAGLHGGDGLPGEAAPLGRAGGTQLAGPAAEGQGLVVPVQKEPPGPLGGHGGGVPVVDPEQDAGGKAVQHGPGAGVVRGLRRAAVVFAEILTAELALEGGPGGGDHRVWVDHQGRLGPVLPQIVQAGVHGQHSSLLRVYARRGKRSRSGGDKIHIVCYDVDKKQKEAVVHGASGDSHHPH